MAPPDRALIVGAGIAGLALARALHALGTAVDVVERRPEASAPGTGILLTGNALRALEQLGLERELLAVGRRVSCVRFTDAEQNELFRLDVAARAGWPPFVSVAREALLRVLLDGARPVTPRWGVTCTQLEPSPEHVEATFSDGTRASYELVVGADGAYSTTRQQLFGAELPCTIASFSGWRFLGRCPEALQHPQYSLGNGCTLLLHPLPGGIVYCGAGPVADALLEGGGGDDLARMRRVFAGFGGVAGEVLDEVSPATTLIPTRYQHLEQAAWSKGRCLLIGDAAHACAPTLAQGAAMALEDACVLAELLASTRTLDEALPAFEARRRPRVEMVQSESLARMRTNQPLDARALTVRNALLAKVGPAKLLGAWSPLVEVSA